MKTIHFKSGKEVTIDLVAYDYLTACIHLNKSFSTFETSEEKKIVVIISNIEYII